MLNYYYNKIIKRDLIQKFGYKNLKDVPKIQRIIVNFGCKDNSLKVLSTTMLVLELITNRRGSLRKAKSSNLVLKVRKGQATGCSILLVNAEAFNFLDKLNLEVFPFLQSPKEVSIATKHKVQAISVAIKQLITFKSLEQQFYLFNNLPYLNVTIVLNTQVSSEFAYCLKSLKIPLKLRRKH